MLSLILISLKQNTSLLTEAQLKHCGHRKQGLAAPREALGGWWADPAPPAASATILGPRQAPFPSPGTEAGRRAGVTHACHPHGSRKRKSDSREKRKVGSLGAWPPAAPSLHPTLHPSRRLPLGQRVLRSEGQLPEAQAPASPSLNLQIQGSLRVPSHTAVRGGFLCILQPL